MDKLQHLYLVFRKNGVGLFTMSDVFLVGSEKAAFDEKKSGNFVFKLDLSSVCEEVKTMQATVKSEISYKVNGENCETQ